MNVKVKLKVPQCKPERHGNWIDCFSRERIEFKTGEVWRIPLGFCIDVGPGREMLLLPRSSFFIKTGCLVANSMGVIDEEYSGDGDEVCLLVYCTRCGTIEKYQRIAQFKIVDKMPPVDFIEVDYMENKTRGGFGSTGDK